MRLRIKMNPGADVTWYVEDIIMHFNASDLAYSFRPADAIISMKMDIPADGVVEITTGYFGDRASEVESALYDFLKEKLVTSRYEGDEDEEDEYEYSEYNEYFGISFKEMGS